MSTEEEKKKISLEQAQELRTGLVAGLLGMKSVDYFFVVGVSREGNLTSTSHGSTLTLIGALEVVVIQMKASILQSSQPDAPASKEKKK